MMMLSPVIFLSALLVGFLQPSNGEENVVTSATISSSQDRSLTSGKSGKETQYYIKSFLSSTYDVEWCVEFVPILDNVLYNICDETDAQVWTFEDDGRIRSLRNPTGCMVTDVDPITSTVSLTYSSSCENAIDDNVFIYNMFDNTISNKMMSLTILDDTLARYDGLIFAEKDSCLLGQKWTLVEVRKNEIMFLGNPCPGVEGCPVCAGDCDYDSDCEGNLRCLQRVESNHPNTGRENVPGCHWKSPNDPERFYDTDFCFRPIDLPGSVNFVGNCDRSTFLCKACEGGCENDNDCEAGLTCMHRDGFEPVPGCGGEAGERDVYGRNMCYDATLPSNEVRWGDSCEPGNQCDICTGNCTVDDDCSGDLRCAHREMGADVPGCTFEDAWLRNNMKHNYCFMPDIFPANAGLVSYVGECSPDTYLCKRCEGGCTNNDDCVGDLRCKPREAFEYVAGCFHEGGEMDMKGKNVCLDNNWDTPKLRDCKWLNKVRHRCAECTSCHNDDDCASGLRCAIRDGLEDVPGCRWGSDGATLHDYLQGTNYCFLPQFSPGIANYVGECSRDGFLCDHCEGACKGDMDCKPGLKCQHRTALDEVPGCSEIGGARDMYGKGLCFDPNFIAPATNTCGI